MNNILRKIKNKLNTFAKEKECITTDLIDFPSCIRIQSPLQTIQSCREIIFSKIPGAYLRFGDGDVNLLHNESELLQSSNSRLAHEMEEAFNLHGKGIIKALPLHSPKYGIWPGMAPGIHGADDEWTSRLLSRCYQYFIGMPIFSNVALAYLASFDQENAISFLKLLKSQNPLFVGNENTPREIVEILFGQTAHIKTPPQNSYYEIDRIEMEVVRQLSKRGRSYDTVVVAMGCSGRILEKRLYLSNHNIFLFDFGSLLDALCGWNTRAWMELSPRDLNTLLSL